MSAGLKAKRQSVAELLTAAGFRAMAHVPSNPEAGIAFVVPGEPYLEPADAFGERVLRFDVWLVIGSPADENAAIADATDTRLEDAIEAIDASDDWYVDDAQLRTWAPGGDTGPRFVVAVLGIRGDLTTH